MYIILYNVKKKNWLKFVFCSGLFDCLNLPHWVLESGVFRLWAGVVIGRPPKANICRSFLWVHLVFQGILQPFAWEVNAWLPAKQSSRGKGLGGSWASASSFFGEVVTLLCGLEEGTWCLFTSWGLPSNCCAFSSILPLYLPQFLALLFLSCSDFPRVTWICLVALPHT